MIQRKAVLGFAVFTVLSLLATWMIWATLARSVDGPTTSYSAYFTDATGLRAGDDVRIAGIRVGRVERVELDGGLAVATFQIQSDQQIYPSTRILIRYQNLIGQRYLALTLPNLDESSAPLDPETAISTDNTEPSFDVSSLLNGFQPLFSTLNPQQINSLSDSIVKTLQGDGVSVAALVAQTASLASSFATKDQILGDIVTNLSQVLGTLAKRNTETQSLIANTTTLVSTLNEHSSLVVGVIEHTADVSAKLTRTISGLRPGLPVALLNFTDVLDLINGHGQELKHSVGQGVPEILASLSRVTQNGSYLNVYNCNLDISLGGVFPPAGTIAQIGGQQHSEVCQP